MRFLRRSLIGMFLLSATLGLIAVAGNSIYGALQTRWAQQETARPARERVFAVNVVEVVPRTISPELVTFGEIRSRRALDLRASSGGQVVWLAEGFADGGTVEAGALLARIDPQDAQSGFDTARADLSEAEAELREAVRALELAEDEVASAREQADLRGTALNRQRDLADRGVGTAAAVETAELAASSARQAVLSRRQALAQAEARIDQARTTLQRREIALAEAERRLADTEIYAAFSGVLSEVTVTQGGIVTNNEQLARIIDPAALEVSFRLSTPQYARLVGDTGRLPLADVSVALDVLGVDLTATGRISREQAAVGEGQTGRVLFASLDAAPGFRPGDFVTVTLREPALEQVALLPASAVDSNDGVLLIGAEDRLEEGRATVLRRQGDDVIVAVGDIAGREVVAERTPLLGAGIKVRPLRPQGEAAVPEGPAMVVLDPDRRARLVAFVEGNNRMPAEAKERMLSQLGQDEVPVEVVERIESRMGG